VRSRGNQGGGEKRRKWLEFCKKGERSPFGGVNGRLSDQALKKMKGESSQGGPEKPNGPWPRKVCKDKAKEESSSKKKKTNFKGGKTMSGGGQKATGKSTNKGEGLKEKKPEK